MKVQFKDWRLKDLPEAPLIPPEKTPNSAERAESAGARRAAEKEP